MTNTIQSKRKVALKLGAAPLGIALAMLAGPAYGQTTPAPAATPAPDQGQEIIVTGSIIRNPAAATASPVVSVTSEDLSNRGISTMTDALQLLPANNAGTAAPSWSSFGFATGASAPSLRGLDDAYTLTLFNGMRTAPYPLADDGYRNFVDINTIPTSVVEKVDVLQDGASATYGSDAIAGVVNVIIKRQITGFHANASAGISQLGDAGERRLSATYGFGDLEDQGFNVYVNGEYQKSDALPLNERGAPFNTADQSSICGTAAQGCLPNSVRNGIQFDGSYNGLQSTTVPLVRQYTPGLAGVGQYQLLNPAAGCQNLTAYTLTPANAAASAADGVPIAASTPATVCQQDLVKQYRLYNSPIERKGATFRATTKLGSIGELYFMFNYYNTTTKNTSSGRGYTGSVAAGGIPVTVSSIFLPAYVCAAGVSTISTITAPNQMTASGCNAGNGTLNPNNPFAASGNLARLVALPPVQQETDTDARTYRFQAGLDGTFGDGWNYNLAAAISRETLDSHFSGQIWLQGLMDAVAKGTYNFVDPSANSAAATQGVFPDEYRSANSKLSQFQVSLNKDLFQLPGGALSAAIMGEYRYEAINDPSANPANLVNPNARYYNGINGVGVSGARHVWTGGYEITAPILDVLKLKAEGSYDSYSTGKANFSPKFEAEFTPIKQIKIRGTYSQGFRIPSFSESFALPTTGYVNGTINCASPTFTAFCAAHASNPSYYSGGYSYGLTSGGNVNLNPEKSKSITAGIVLRPTHNVTLTADYWSIKITNVIVPVSATVDLITQYYTNNGVINVPGITVVKGVADPQNLNALPLIGQFVGSYKNADAFLAKGIDLSASANFPIGSSGMKWSTTANASYLIRLQQTNDDGSISRYDGTLGACNITACSGAPAWRVTWQNTLDFNHKGNITLTAYYTSGYASEATDSGGVYGDCQTSANNGQLVSYPNGDPVQCHAKAVFDLDGHGEIKVANKFTLYVDVLNILNQSPTYEPNAAYGLYQFNPAWSDRLFIGRYMRFGAKVDF